MIATGLPDPLAGDLSESEASANNEHLYQLWK